ncbi:VOC family protein [Sphingomonas bacterium]|uniref:VOC family protein n=1 Tax=Sphingomonas bacterium TaxID=1895847 RepID=UPI0015762B9F|nr:VOC family protein [Sphingomonas bacterium]
MPDVIPSPTQPCSSLKISETILKTGRLDEMIAWYTTVLGVPPFFEHNPDAGTRPLDLGGQTRASDLRMCFFRLSLDFPYVQTIGIFQEPGTGLMPVKDGPGLHHMQLTTSDLDGLCVTYERLLGHGMRPHRSADHGPMTSFYYRDPDGNNVEITAQNFATLEQMIGFMASDAFKANPSGREIDPGDYVAGRRGRTSATPAG